MTFNNFIENCLLMVKNNPKLAETTVIFASDDEGNSFHKVTNTPTPMKVDDLEERYLDCAETSKEECNAICIN